VRIAGDSADGGRQHEAVYLVDGHRRDELGVAGDAGILEGGLHGRDPPHRLGVAVPHPEKEGLRLAEDPAFYMPRWSTGIS
jgi:hypothetical protein